MEEDATWRRDGHPTVRASVEDRPLDRANCDNELAIHDSALLEGPACISADISAMIPRTQPSLHLFQSTDVAPAERLHRRGAAPDRRANLHESSQSNRNVN